MFMKRLIIDGVRKRYSAGSVLSTLVETGLRFLQFVFAIAVIGLYAQDVNRARKAGDAQNPKWVYATAVGALSSISALVYMLVPCATRRPLSQVRFLHLPTFIFDGVVVICWLVVFGVFAKLYIKVDDEKDKDLKRMKHAVFVDLVNLSFWIVSLAWCGVRWWRGGKEEREMEKIYDGGEMREV